MTTTDDALIARTISREDDMLKWCERKDFIQAANLAGLMGLDAPALARRLQEVINERDETREQLSKTSTKTARVANEKAVAIVRAEKAEIERDAAIIERDTTNTDLNDCLAEWIVRAEKAEAEIARLKAPIGNAHIKTLVENLRFCSTKKNGDDPCVRIAPSNLTEASDLIERLSASIVTLKAQLAEAEAGKTDAAFDAVSDAWKMLRDEVIPELRRENRELKAQLREADAALLREYPYISDVYEEATCRAIIASRARLSAQKETDDEMS